jgi:hypothetical protein
MSEQDGADSLVRSDALLADVETACPCRSCGYDWPGNISDMSCSTTARRAQNKCPFYKNDRAVCVSRAAWQNWKKWTHRILGAMNCFKIACEETKSANNRITEPGRWRNET